MPALPSVTSLTSLTIATTVTAYDAPWPPLPEAVYLPTFPVSALGSDLRDFVEGVAASRNVPVDAPASLSLAAISAAAAKRAQVRVQQGDTHPLPIWVLVTLASGEGKSPVLSDVIAPLEARERQLIEAASAGNSSIASKRRVLARRINLLESRCARTTDDAQRSVIEGEVVDLMRQRDAIPEPTTPRLITEDATTERLVQLLAQNNGTMLLASDEGSTLFGGMMRRSKPGAENMEPLLKAYSGATIRVDRVGRPDVIVESPALSLALAIQPTVLQSILGANSFSGRGLLERFLYCQPRRTTRRNQHAPSLDHEAIRQYRATINWIIERDLQQRMAEVPTLEFDADAAARFRSFSAEIDIPSETVSPLLAGWMNKLRTNAARIAGILHVADEGIGRTSSISLGTVERAIEIARYFRAHAEDALATHVSVPGEAALRSYIQRNQLSVFRPHEAHRAMQARFHRIDDVLRVVAAWQEQGLVRPHQSTEPRSGAGRPPLEFEVHPGLLRA